MSAITIIDEPENPLRRAPLTLRGETRAGRQVLGRARPRTVERIGQHEPVHAPVRFRRAHQALACGCVHRDAVEEIAEGVRQHHQHAEIAPDPDPAAAVAQSSLVPLPDRNPKDTESRPAALSRSRWGRYRGPRPGMPVWRDAWRTGSTSL